MQTRQHGANKEVAPCGEAEASATARLSERFGQRNLERLGGDGLRLGFLLEEALERGGQGGPDANLGDGVGLDERLHGAGAVSYTHLEKLSGHI